jgi:hypothetical protein
MLAEKFFLVLETFIRHIADPATPTYPDGSPKVMSLARFIPIKLAKIR